MVFTYESMLGRIFLLWLFKIYIDYPGQLLLRIIAWYIATFILSFVSLAWDSSCNNDEDISLLLSSVWLVVFILTAISVWFVGSYELPMIIARIVWGYIAIMSGAWAMVMLVMIGSHNKS